MVGAGTRDNCPYVDKDLCGTDSELGQMLMTCGKLSNQATSVKSTLNVSHCPSEQHLMGSDIIETLDAFKNLIRTRATSSKSSL